RDWTSEWEAAIPGRAEGIIVRPRSDFGLRSEDDEYIYVVGAAADYNDNNYLELLMMAFDAETQQSGNKEPRWDGRWASHAGDVDWPVSLVEQLHLGGFNIRRMVIGSHSTH